MIKFIKSFVSATALLFVVAAVLTSCTASSVAEVVEVTESSEATVETQQREKIPVGFENWHQSDEFTVDVQNGILEVQDKFNVKTIVYDSSDMDSSKTQER